MKKRVLIITYYWPPSGGAGVQRWLKFVKYLPEFGWEPVVYTPENPEYPILDHTLQKDIPAGIEVLKVRGWEPYQAYKKFVGLKKGDKISGSFTSDKKKPKITENLAVWIRGNLFIPDARKFWIKRSVKYLQQYLKNNPVDAIVSTGPPHSMHLIGYNLKLKTNTPWIADFRDPWTHIDFYHELRLSGLADRKHRKLEKQVLQNADKVVVVSEGMKTDFEQIYPGGYTVIPNGFDTSDEVNTEYTPGVKFSLAHIGTMAKTRNPEVLWTALEQLSSHNKSFAENLEIKLIGKVDYSVSESLKKHHLHNYVKLIPYLPHDQVTQEQQKSTVLLLLINNTPNSGMILTGKLFEYLLAKRPILCIGPADGDAAKIIRETESGFVSGYDDLASAKKQIEILYEDHINKKPFSGGVGIGKYSRHELTAKLDDCLRLAMT